MGRPESPSSLPLLGKVCNVMLSVQYHGNQRRRDFEDLSFSTAKGVERAIKVLNLDDDFYNLGLPSVKKPDYVFRSSFGYPDTIEILYPDCVAGQVIMDVAYPKHTRTYSRSE